MDQVATMSLWLRGMRKVCQKEVMVPMTFLLAAKLASLSLFESFPEQAASSFLRSASFYTMRHNDCTSPIGNSLNCQNSSDLDLDKVVCCRLLCSAGLWITRAG